MTEPNHGSDPGRMKSTIKDKGDALFAQWGQMSWITNSSIADIAIVWAKDETGVVRGMVVEKEMRGLTAP
ncbi:MAG: acyl-CoA dehydrogenase family protein [Bacteroidales bacterium]